MKKVLRGAAFFGCAMLLVSGGAFAAIKSGDKSYLYVLRSKSANIVKHTTAKGNQYDLVVSDPHVIYFTDRPIREAKRVSLRRLLIIWNSTSADSFKYDPPNAYVASTVGIGSREKFLDNVVTLSKPSLVKVGSDEGVSFKVVPVGNKVLPNVKGVPMEIVVDSGGCWMGGGNCPI